MAEILALLKLIQIRQMNTMEPGFHLLPLRQASFPSSAGERVGFLWGEIWTAIVHISECELVSSCFHNPFNTRKNCNMRLNL